MPTSTSGNGWMSNEFCLALGRNIRLFRLKANFLWEEE